MNNGVLHGISCNNVFIVSFLAWLIAQVLKVIINLLIYGKFDIMRLLGSGGMPSSHSALVMAMSVSVGKHTGWSSPIFAVAAVVSVIVMYDAAGVRRATGKQAEVLNQIISDIYHGTHISQEKLKELIGHTPFEVLIGAILGMLLGWFI